MVIEAEGIHNRIARLLNQRTNLENLERNDVLEATTDCATSVGGRTFDSASPEDIERNHKENTHENVNPKNEVAEQQNMLEKIKKEKMLK